MKCFILFAGLVFVLGLNFGAEAQFDMGESSGDTSLPVTLSSFTAQAGDGEGTLHWVTESETDNLGYHVYRALEENASYECITLQLIPGAGSSPTENTYCFTDVRLTNGVTYWYKIEDVAFDGTREMHGPISLVPQQSLPSEFGLSQNVPNPFNPQTTIAYQLSEAADVRLTVCNAAGQIVQVLTDAAMEAGTHTITWDARGFGSGVYLVRLEAGTFIETRKMVKIE
ncbi:MAG: T9SS type A sorting domain-containing protein [Candidatus Latescibacterota bacterium]